MGTTPHMVELVVGPGQPALQPEHARFNFCTPHTEQSPSVIHSVHAPSLHDAVPLTGPAHAAPTQPSHTRACGRVHVASHVVPAIFSHAVQVLQALELHSTVRVAGSAAGHAWVQPTHWRPCVLDPSPHSTAHGAVSTHAVHALEIPAKQATLCVLGPAHVPRQPLHARKRGCVPEPHVVLHGPLFTHAVHVRLIPA